MKNARGEDYIAWVDDELGRRHDPKFYLLSPGSELSFGADVHVDYLIRRDLAVWLLMPVLRAVRVPRRWFWERLGKDRARIVGRIGLQFAGEWHMDRWEGDVHYYDFTTGSVKRWPNRDAFTVAEAWIYSEDQSHQLGIVVLVSGMDLATKATTLEAAIRDGGRLRDELVSRHREEARLLKEDRTRLYSWRGEAIT